MHRSDALAPETVPLVKIAEGREAEIFRWSESEVLRLFRDPDAGERADREMAALDAVHATLPCVPVPSARIEWEGRPGILMERLNGEGILTELQRRPWRLWALGRLFGRTHASVNQLAAPPELPSLRSDLHRRIGSSNAIPAELRSAALEELDGLPDGNALCHGDFQPDNVLLCPTGPAVIDWPSATRGDACGDFAGTMLMLDLGALPPGAPPLIRWAQWTARGLFARAYASGYEEELRHDPNAVRRWRFVCTVDRLRDEIREERTALLREAERLLALRTRRA